MDKIKRDSKRVLIAVVGFAVLVAGIVMIPYPGPGWLVVFAGLAILAREFTWAQNVLDYAKNKYDAWQNWLNKQPTALRAFFWAATAIIVILTIWLLNGYGLINRWLSLGQDWVDSPLF